MMENWGDQLRFTQPSLWARESLLALQRLVLGASSLGAQVGDCWLQYAKLCRSAGYYETANQAILEAQASAQTIRRSNEEKFRVAVLVSQAALQFIHGLSSDYIAPEEVTATGYCREALHVNHRCIMMKGWPKGAQNGLGIVASVLLVVCVTAISDYRQSLQFKDLDTEKEKTAQVTRSGQRQKISVYDLIPGDIVHLSIGDQDGSCKMLVTTIGMRTQRGKLMATLMKDDKPTASNYLSIAALPVGETKKEMDLVLQKWNI
ncbi:Calcium-transporting ATPase 10, plasma membrane-type [Vitis vinifera]|uniref:Calcium-transporting ATPase 10, plasma membrane-type n=1 Tax=Vitis vinifera TaxID=29760 RepID=A0A438D9A9_VITVI|nr:Calcium-transporting ATPase 10, plasma membrane-type [Vitis vinifera]